MVSATSGQALASTLLKAGGNVFQAAAKKAGADPVDNVIAALEKTDPEKAAELRKKQEEAKSILQQLQSTRTDMSEQRKAAAAEKVQRIKQQLQALRLMASINPKAAAKQAAQLSRELAQAAKEYSSASGGNAAAMGTGGTAPVATGATDATAAASASTEAQAQAEGAAPQTATAPAEAGNAKDDKAFAQPASEDKAKEDEDKPAQESIQDKINAATGVLGRSRADADFAKEVDDIKTKLKSLIELAKKKMSEKDKSSMGFDIRGAESALRDVDRSLGTIISGGYSGAVAAVNILI